MKVLALDYGAARTGVAVSDATGTIARPLDVVERAATPEGLARIGQIVQEQAAERVVVGLPLTLRGEEGSQALRVRRFADACAPLGLPVELYDERYTTAEAIRLGAPDVDAAAAALLLEDYLKERRR